MGDESISMDLYAGVLQESGATVHGEFVAESRLWQAEEKVHGELEVFGMHTTTVRTAVQINKPLQAAWRSCVENRGHPQHHVQQ